MSKRRAAEKRGATTKAVQREIAKRIKVDKQPSLGAARAAKVIDENVPLFCDANCPKHDAHHALYQQRLAEVIDRETGSKEMLSALEDLLGTNPDVQKGECIRCGRQYADIHYGVCPSDDCPAFGARAAIAKAKGQ